MPIVAIGTVGELVHVEFTEQNRPRLCQAEGNRRIIHWYVISENPRPRSGTHPLGGAEIFQGDGDAMQRATPLA